MSTASTLIDDPDDNFLSSSNSLSDYNKPGTVAGSYVLFLQSSFYRWYRGSGNLKDFSKPTQRVHVEGRIHMLAYLSSKSHAYSHMICVIWSVVTEFQAF